MPDPIVVVDRSRVREHKLDEVRARVGALAEFVEANESRPIAYNATSTPTGRR